MDGRVLINRSRAKSLGDIAELADWKLRTPSIHAGGSVHLNEPVSLIIPTFFNAQLKKRSLAHLLDGLQDCRSVREIILVSSDGERDDFKDLEALAAPRPIRIVESDPHNRGKSRNRGAAAATSPNLLFLDDDMLLKNWRSIDVLVSRLLTTGQDCALFPRRQYARFPLLFDSTMLREAIGVWRKQAHAKGSAFLYDPLKEGAADLPMLFCFPGCFMLIRSAAFARLGGFVEDFVGWGFEDTDFGVRAMRELKVMNLFRAGEPLLHIDHPVSPYKSEEHNVNFKKFYAAPETPDVYLFCRRIFRGTDFSPADPVDNTKTWTEPLKQIAAQGVPLEVERAEGWWLSVSRQRLQRHLSPMPMYIALHGSQAEGTAGDDDDYDVLGLYAGKVQEFFVSSGGARVEIECADIGRFEYIAAHPAIHSFTGPMELAKVARARLLWGNVCNWEKWTSHLLERAMTNGWCYWLVLGLGLRRHAAKYGPMADCYFRSLGKLRAHAIASHQFQLNGEGDFKDEAALALAALHALDKFRGDWRETVRAGQSIFELQVPEVWTALHALVEWQAFPSNRLGSDLIQHSPGRLEMLKRQNQV